MKRNENKQLPEEKVRRIINPEKTSLRRKLYWFAPEDSPTKFDNLPTPIEKILLLKKRALSVVEQPLPTVDLVTMKEKFKKTEVEKKEESVEVKEERKKAEIPKVPKDIPIPPKSTAMFSKVPQPPWKKYPEIPSLQMREAVPAKELPERGAADYCGIVDPLEWTRILKEVPSIGFFYLVPVIPKKSIHYNPYFLRTARYEEVDKKDYLTISSLGVVHVAGTESQFTPLQDWLREYSLYLKLIKLDTFRKFRIQKAFAIWRKTTRVCKIQLCEQKLERTLFILNKRLSTALFEVWEKCYMFSLKRLFQIDNITTYTLKEFEEIAISSISKVSEQLKVFREDVKRILHHICCLTLWKHGFVSDFKKPESGLVVPEEVSTRQSKRKLDISANIDTSYLLKGPSIRSTMLEQDQTEFDEYSHFDQSVKRRICTELANFTLLVDYSAASVIHQIARNTYQELIEGLSEIVEKVFSEDEKKVESSDDDEEGKVDLKSDLGEAPTFRKEAIFSVELTLDTEGNSEEFIVEPSKNVFISTIENIFAIGRKKLQNFLFFTNDPLFNYFVRPVINNLQEKKMVGCGPSISSMFRHDDYLDGIKEVKNCLSQGFVRVDNYISSLSDIKQFYLENKKNDILSIIGKETDINFFSELLSRFHSQHQKVLTVVDTHHEGLFLVDNRKMKNIILPSVEKGIQTIHQRLCEMTKENVSSLVEEVRNAQNKLDYAPTTSKELVENLDFLTHVQTRALEIENEVGLAKDMYQLMSRYEIEIDPDDWAAYNNLATAVRVLAVAVAKTSAERELNIKKLRSCLESDKESLRKEVILLRSKSENPKLLDPSSDPKEIEESLEKLHRGIKEIEDRCDELNEYEKSVALTLSRFRNVEELREDIDLKQLCWDSLESLQKTAESISVMPFDMLSTDEITALESKYGRIIKQLEKGLPANKLVPQLAKGVNNLKEKLPVIKSLLNPKMEQRHWKAVYEVLGHEFDDASIITLRQLEECDVLSHIDEIKEISLKATAEANLKGILKKVEDVWRTTEYPVVPHKSGKDVYILGNAEDIQQLLEDSIVNVSMIESSKHVEPMRQEVQEWSKLLELFSKTLDEWLSCQKNWLYLESIFSSQEIHQQIPEISKMFANVDKSWKDIMRRVYRLPLALKITTQPGMLEEFHYNNKLLEQVISCLEVYLESKRISFPRFYFLSNDELLDIISQLRNPMAVQPHLSKCFSGINELDIVEIGTQDDSNAEAIQSYEIRAMVSPEKEKIVFSKGLKIKGNVEDWMAKLEEVMLFTIHQLMKEELKEYAKTTREEWLKALRPLQIVLAITQIDLCQHVTAALRVKARALPAMQELEVNCFNELNKYAKIMKKDIPPLMRNVLYALITIDVHARDVISALVKKKISDLNAFDWLQQLRYYWDKDFDNCIVRMGNSEHVYGYEYLGASSRLVITPLTDRCYLCLLGALQLRLGGAPVGPAGTGKTETVKDLAKALAKHCVVFNCSEGLDYKMMGRFLSGLVQSGVWCCFDEFNRIDIEVLSVVAQQLLIIKNAKTAMITHFVFEGREIKLIPSCATFITLNPGYAGRVELPSNLKSLFRPFAMVVPDYALISEVILYSEGFEHSKTLAKKITYMYKMCWEQLSQQDHYDFGMRSLKSVLVMAGRLKAENPQKKEEEIIIRALRDSNLPKFLARDELLFKDIIDYLFPGTQYSSSSVGNIKNTIEECLIMKQLQPLPQTVKKIIQLFETMNVRHGVMLVGPAGGGKTTSYQILKEALDKLSEEEDQERCYFRVQAHILNPKSISIPELFGEVNPLTLDWKEGLLSHIFRIAVQGKSDLQQWIVCDGPVDPVWIENMNSVLDDNKVLCLPNSERIILNPFVHLIFEVSDLIHASPSTVSRCGMVYVDCEELGWRPFVLTWLQRLPRLISNDVRKYLLQCFDKYIKDGLSFLKTYCIEMIPQVAIGKVSSLCSLLQSMLCSPSGVDIGSERGNVRPVTLLAFMFCYWWTFGGNLNEASLQSFDNFFLSQFERDPDVKAHSLKKSFGDYHIDTVYKRMESWDNLVGTYTPNESSAFDIIVPNVDTVRFGFLMERFLESNWSILLSGLNGVGKTVIARNFLSSIIPKIGYVSAYMNFSAGTMSKHVQQFLENRLDRKRKSLYSAPVDKRFIFFVDDLNMPSFDPYGVQAPIELLRQYQNFHGFYDRQKLFWINVENVMISGAFTCPGAGRKSMSARFLRHFAILCVRQPQQETLRHILTSVLTNFFADFNAKVQGCVNATVVSVLEHFRRVLKDFLPTPSKSHYVFTLWDISKFIQGVMQVTPGAVSTKKEVFYLVWHECQRVFHDRLVDKADKYTHNRNLATILWKTFGHAIQPEIVETNPILFGDILRYELPREKRVYELMADVKRIKAILLECLEEYNAATFSDLKLVFFTDCVEHIARIARIIRQHRGHALMIGVNGSGKKSAARLAIYLCGYCCFQIELSKGYDYGGFHEDLKRLYNQAVFRNEKTVFLFNDNQVVVEEFLEDIHNILNTGAVPNLFELDEYEEIISQFSDKTKEGEVVDKDAVYRAFISKARSNLHIALTMSPVGEAFRNRCRMFPSLINCCTLDWFTEWPAEALFSIAEDRLLRSNRSLENSVNRRLAQVCVNIHLSVKSAASAFCEELHRKYYVTPSTYLELINVYIHLVRNLKEKLLKEKERFESGISKLQETKKEVVKLQAELEAKEPELKEQSEKTDTLVKKLAAEQSEADKVRQSVIEEETVAKIKADETAAIKEDAERDLNEALPVYEAACSALQSLDKYYIAELRVFKTPPELVKIVMEAVCTLMGTKTDWPTAKAMLADPSFIKQLAEYDKDNIPDATLKKIQKFIDDPKFAPVAVEKSSKACKTMCIWVRAIYNYAQVSKVMEPKRQRLAEAEKELQQVLTVLQEKQQKLLEVEAQNRLLKAEYKQNLEKQVELKKNIKQIETLLKRASQLTIALMDEEIRWDNSVTERELLIKNVVGDAMLSAACIAYYGPFISRYRKKLIVKWCEYCNKNAIPVSENHDLVSFLVNPNEVQVWENDGLPKDRISQENAILITRGKRWPLIIDPQDQAARWIRSMERENNLQVIKQSDENFLRIIELCITAGTPVLVEDVGTTLDPSLKPILLQQTYNERGSRLIQIGDTSIEYDEKFSLYLTTKLQNPQYLADVFALVKIIDFSVTREGLEECLLSDVVRLESPELEDQRVKCITDIVNDQMQLNELDEKILTILFTSQSNILDDEKLIVTLHESKQAASALTTSLSTAVKTQQNISSVRDNYRCVSVRGAVLYFVTMSLSEINSMYQFSLKYFTQVFCHAIESHEKDPDLERHLQTLLHEVTYHVYINISRGLFEDDKLVFSFMLTIAILIENKGIQEDEWTYLIKGPSKEVDVLKEKPSHADWLSETDWRNCQELECNLQCFNGISSFFVDVPFFVQIGSHKIQLNISHRPPSGGQKSPRTDIGVLYTSFQKIILIKVFQEHKVVLAITEFIMENIGASFVDNPPTDLMVFYQSMSNTTPLIFILSPGSDPMASFVHLAQTLDFANRSDTISLGQGQGPVAESLIKEASRRGRWILLQNCHLAMSWMPMLENITKDLSKQGAKVHQAFRLFLTSAPSDSFPVSILKNSIKLTEEPPKGLRANLKRALHDIDAFAFESHVLQGEWKKMIFGICFFHAVILERKKFGPLGWNVQYEFTDSDCGCAIENIKLLCKEGIVRWDAMEYLTGEIVYGGRVTDLWDQRCLKTILKGFFSPTCIKQGYKYSPSGIYYAPEGDTMGEYWEYVDTLPIIDEPEIFGMHDNADVIFQVKEASKLIDKIKEVEPRSRHPEQTKISDEEIVVKMADHILTKFENAFDVSLPSETSAAHDSSKPLTVVLFQEVERYKKLLETIDSSLNSMKQALEGVTILDEHVEHISKSFLKNKVPQLWSKSAYLSTKALGSWINDLLKRLNFIKDWMQNGVPDSFWFPGFFSPSAFLAGIIQNDARRNQWPIDQLSFHFHVFPHYLPSRHVSNVFNVSKQVIMEPETTITELIKPSVGVLIHGLFIEAAFFDTKTMKLCDQKYGEMNPPFPVIHIEVEMNYEPSVKDYICPLYKTPERNGQSTITGHSENFVTAIHLPSFHVPEFWVKRGTALLCEITE